MQHIITFNLLCFEAFQRRDTNMGGGDTRLWVAFKFSLIFVDIIT